MDRYDCPMKQCCIHIKVKAVAKIVVRCANSVHYVREEQVGAFRRNCKGTTTTRSRSGSPFDGSLYRWFSYRSGGGVGRSEGGLVDLHPVDISTSKNSTGN